MPDINFSDLIAILAMIVSLLKLISNHAQQVQRLGSNLNPKVRLLFKWQMIKSVHTKLDLLIDNAIGCSAAIGTSSS